MQLTWHQFRLQLLVIALVSLQVARADQSKDNVDLTQQAEQSAQDAPRTFDGAAAAAGFSQLLQELDSLPDLNGAKTRELDNENASDTESAPGYLCKLGGLIGQCKSGARKLVHDFIRPTKEYLELVQRYRKWYWAYSALFEATKKDGEQADPEYLSPSNLITLEFAHVERELYKELREKQKAEAEQQDDGGTKAEKKDEAEIESTDFLFEALRRLIVRLETILASIQDEGQSLPAPPLADEASQGRLSVADLKATEEFRESMDRLKRIAASTARGIVVPELIQVGKIAAFNALATQLANAEPVPGSSLSLIAPFVAMLGTANSSLLVSYLTDVRMRAAMRLVEGINPLPMLMDKLVERAKKG